MTHAPAGPAPQSVPGATPVRERIRDAILRTLSREERLLVLLWYAEGMCPEEIGVCLDLTPQRVGTLHQSILGRIEQAALDRRRPS